MRKSKSDRTPETVKFELEAVQAQDLPKQSGEEGACQPVNRRTGVQA